MSNYDQHVTSRRIDMPEFFFGAMISVTKIVAALICVPLDFILRPNFGSRYISHLTIPIAFAVFAIPYALSTVFSGRLPSSADAVFDMSFLAFLFSGYAVYHSHRIWRLMKNPHKETYSWSEGPHLRVFNRLPNPTWGRVRLVYEPLSVLLTAIVLNVAGIFDTWMLLYLFLAVQALYIRAATEWYESFVYLRDALDSKAVSEQLAMVVKNVSEARNLNPSLASAMHASVPPEQRVHVASVLSGIDTKAA